MSKRYAMTLCGLLAVSLVACQPGTLLPGGVDGVPGAGAKQGLPITLRVALPGGMGVQALPKTLFDVRKLNVKLYKQVGGAPVLADDEMVGEANLNDPRASAVATINVSGDAGTYYVAATAFDGAATPAVLNEGGEPTISINRVTITAAKEIIYSQVAGQTVDELVVEITLAAGTPGVDSSNLTVAGGEVAAYGWAPRHYGLSLVNNASGRVSANPPTQTTSYQLTNVQPGLAVPPANGFSHEVWGFITGPGGKATPASWLYGNASAAGKINDPIDVLFSVRPLYSPFATAMAAGGLGHGMDGHDRLVFYDSDAGKFKMIGKTSETTYGAAFDSLAVAGVTGFLIDPASNLFFSTGTGIQLAQPAGSTGIHAGPAMLPGLTTVANIGPIAMDMRMSAYWYDTATKTIKKSRWAGRGYLAGGSSYAAPEEISGPITNFRGLKVSSYGHLYFADGTEIKRRRLDEDGRTYDPAATIATADGLVTSMTLDYGEHLYFTDEASHKVKMVGPALGTVYTIAGSGTATGANTYATGVDPTTLNLDSPTSLAVNQDGEVTFLSKGADPAEYYLRTFIAPAIGP